MQDSTNRPTEDPSGPTAQEGDGGDAGQSAPFRSGYVAICGYPNAGKSTLMNQILDFKLAIVTPKPQTTRRRTLGILTRPGAQMIGYSLQAAMMKQVEQAIADADLILYLVDVKSPRMAPGVAAVSSQKPVLVVLNKADLLRRREDALPQIETLREQGSFAGFRAVSALTGAGVSELIADIETRLTPGPQFYPEDQLTEHPERFFVAELIREAIFGLYRDEVPYSTEVGIEEFREAPDRKDLIRATIFVESDSQKGIVIGKGGAAIKRLGQTAREAIEGFLERPVFLDLRVKVLAKWRRDEQALKRFGF